MMRTLAVMGFLALVSMLAPEAAFCQPGAARPSFDIADVHLSPRADWVKNSTHLMQGGYLSGDRYELRRATMLDMIKVGYDIDADKVYSTWLALSISWATGSRIDQHTPEISAPIR